MVIIAIKPLHPDAKFLAFIFQDRSVHTDGFGRFLGKLVPWQNVVGIDEGNILQLKYSF